MTGSRATLRPEVAVPDTITAVVVTFNRKDLLVRALRGLLAQTRPVDRVVLVDNASTDGTLEHLHTVGLLPDARFRVERLATNTGGAGGFSHGVKVGHADGADWLWLMDDDVVPEPDCLAKLLARTDVSSCLHPAKRFLDGSPYRWEQAFDPVTGFRTMIEHDGDTRDLSFVQVGCFEGMLIARDVVDRIGVPSAHYFLGEDDALYGFKASLFTNVAYVRDAHMTKLLPGPGPDPAAWKVYYMIRNRLYLHKDVRAVLGDAESELKTSVVHLFLVMRSLQLARRDRAYLAPALRGLRDGVRYVSTERRLKG